MSTCMGCLDDFDEDDLVWQNGLVCKECKGESKWTVWVGGSEMSSNLLSHAQALKIVKVWKDLGYDDVVVEEVA